MKLLILLLLLPAFSLGQDKTKPTVKINQVAYNNEYEGHRLFIIKATDNKAITHVDLYHGDTLIFADYTTPPDFYIEWNSNSVLSGDYKVTAKAYDAAGNVGTASVWVTVNNPEVIKTSSIWVVKDGAIKVLPSQYYVRKKFIDADNTVSYQYWDDAGERIDLVAYWDLIYKQWNYIGGFVL